MGRRGTVAVMMRRSVAATEIVGGRTTCSTLQPEWRLGGGYQSLSMAEGGGGGDASFALSGRRTKARVLLTGWEGGCVSEWRAKRKEKSDVEPL